jgi:hypothetical protein
MITNDMTERKGVVRTAKTSYTCTISHRVLNTLPLQSINNFKCFRDSTVVIYDVFNFNI